MGQGLEEVSEHPAPALHWETQGTQRTKPQTRSQAGQGQPETRATEGSREAGQGPT